MARENPKLAQEQLGISAAVFNLHYNQPSLEDRLMRRDILPAVGPPPENRPAFVTSTPNPPAALPTQMDFRPLKDKVRRLDVPSAFRDAVMNEPDVLPRDVGFAKLEVYIRWIATFPAK